MSTDHREFDSRPSNPPRIQPPAKGMTFVELLIAITVVLLSGVSLLMACHSVFHLTEVAQQSTVALNDLKDLMERIKATPFARLTTDFPDGAIGGGPPDRYGAVVGGYTLPAEQIVVRHRPTTTTDPRELVVELTWTNRNRQYLRSLATMRASQAS